ncbi:hypothetical protein GZL_06119 [Streptomyces sp. 769]|nr:hypothetical protein GZL_06119 [Streptomyces sp. 769]
MLSACRATTSALEYWDRRPVRRECVPGDDRQAGVRRQGLRPVHRA